MRKPTRPPDTAKAFAAILQKKQFDLALKISGWSHMTDTKGRYLHWDDFRFKSPPEGFTAKEWWIATRRARTAASQSFPLSDEAGQTFTHCEPASLRSQLHDLDMNAGGALALDSTALTPGEAQLHLARSLAEEPFASSLIEGAATTRTIAKKLIFEGRAPRTKDERMVLNNYRALEFVRAHKDDELSLPILLELHRLVTQDTLDHPEDAGRLRTTDDIRVVDDTTGEILHQPPSASALPERLKRLLQFANKQQDSTNWIHPLLKAFALHFMLSFEHPFVDGNGRVARALFYWAALRSGYWLIEYVSISSIITESKIAYGKAFLFVETDDCDLTYFFIYHAEILETAIARLGAFVTRKRKEVQAFARRLGQIDTFNHRQSWLLNELARDRATQITIHEHQQQHGVSYLTARSDLETLVAQGLLQKKKAGRSSIYRPANDLMRRLGAETAESPRSA